MAKSKVPHHSILSVEVTGGFLSGAKLSFADSLNAVIGGRGTGKTTVLELIRYALDVGLEREGSASRSRLVQNNLDNGQIRVDLRTDDGIRYTVERAWDEPPRILDERGAPKEITLEGGLLFS